VHLVATQVTAAPAAMSGGSGATYDTGTVTATVGSTNFTVNYGQTSTAATVASSLASAISAGQLGLTATAGAGGALTVTSNTAGTTDNGIPVTLNSSTSEPSLFSSPSFSGTSGSLGAGTDGTVTPGTIYSYSIPAPGAPAGYDGVGNVRSFTDLINGQWTQIGYDTLNRLTTATVAGTPSTTLTWSYDAFGNRKTQGPDGGTSVYPAGNNRIQGYSYDAAGNITDDNSQYGYQYGYDGEGRLCVVYNKTMASYTGYAYDGLGNRVAKGAATNGLNCDNNLTPSSTFIVGQNGEQLDSLNAAGALYSNTFANGQLLATYQFATSNWSFALNDWLGTKRFVADATGKMVESCTGFPFGDGLDCAGAGDPNGLHFTGKERDSESGNDYFGARYYGSSLGRWMSPDSLNLTDDRILSPANTLNKYVYGGNNPLKYIDPDGKDITVFYESPSGLTSPGHIMFVAANQQTGDAAAMSFGPVHDSEYGFTLLGSPVNSTNSFGLTGANGQPMTADDLRQSYSSLTIQTSPEEAQQVIEFIRNLSDSANPYELYKTNCTTVCREALKAIGILPHDNKNLTPNGLWRSLFAKYAGSYWHNNFGWSTSKPGTDFGNPRGGYDSFQLLELLNKHCTDSWNGSTNTLTSTCN
jgi:RHS repeat-associated protein